MAKNGVGSVLDVHNTVTASDVTAILNMQLDAIAANPENVNVIPPLFIHGSPGIGKSTIVNAVCKSRGIEFIDVRLAQMDPCDIRGLPVPNKELKQMDWFVNGTWPRDPNGKGIIFLDELSSCDRSVACASYELVLDRRLGKLYSVPPGYLIVAAGNLTTDRAIATTMSSALANRFMHVELTSSAEDWVEWGAANDIHPAVLGFIKTRPENLFSMKNQNLERGWPSPRAWHRVSEMCKIFDVDKSGSKTLLQKIVYGLVGNSAGIDFMTYYKLNEEFDNILDYMTNPAKQIKIPAENDRKWAMCTSMVYLLWKGKTPEDEEKRIDGFYRICMELGTKNSDFATYAMSTAMAGATEHDKEMKAMKLFKCKHYKKWAEDFGKAFKKRLSI